MLLGVRLRREPRGVAAKWVSTLCRQLLSALGADDWPLRPACGDKEKGEQDEQVAWVAHRVHLNVPRSSTRSAGAAFRAEILLRNSGVVGRRGAEALRRRPPALPATGARR